MYIELTAYERLARACAFYRHLTEEEINLLGELEGKLQTSLNIVEVPLHEAVTLLEQKKHALRKLLTPDEWRVLKNRYGLLGDTEEEKQPIPVKDLSRILDLTQSRLRQIEQSALKAVREFCLQNLNLP